MPSRLTAMFNEGTEHSFECQLPAGVRSGAKPEMAAVWRRVFSSAAAGGRIGLWAQLRDSRAGLWTQSLLIDYREACKELIVGARDSPGKAAFYGLLLVGAGTCAYNSPTDKSFQAVLLESSNQLLLLSPWVRSGQADQHIQKLITMQNQGRLRYQSLVLFSLMYAAPYDADTNIYDAQCKYLVPRWSDFPSRVLDVGFLGRWWVLGSKMKDWDINDDEFSHLPPELQKVTPQNLHSAENERLFELKFQPVVLQEKDIQKSGSS